MNPQNREQLNAYFMGLWKQASGLDRLQGFDPYNPAHLDAVRSQLFREKVAAFDRWLNAPLYEKAAAYDGIHTAIEYVRAIETSLDDLEKKASMDTPPGMGLPMDDYFDIHQAVSEHDGVEPLARDHFERVMGDPSLREYGVVRNRKLRDAMVGGGALGGGLATGAAIAGMHFGVLPRPRLVGPALIVGGTLAGMGAGAHMSNWDRDDANHWGSAVERNR